VAGAPQKLKTLASVIEACRACPRLVRYREQVTRERRAAYRHEVYWGRPVPGLGDPAAWLVIVGLAPGAHGANRTGRMFTGDRSGAFLYSALHRAGLSNHPVSLSRDDGLRLRGTYITAPCRCAPPDNRPLPIELRRCGHFLDEEVALLSAARVFLALGAIAWQASLKALERRGTTLPRPLPKFSHGAEFHPGNDRVLLGSYHVSQQNTQTGRLTPAMFDRILARARELRLSRES
jgi:uracil-DNA glycosylase family 4